MTQVDDRDAKLAEALALLREVTRGLRSVDDKWHGRVDALLAPPPDPDALAKETAWIEWAAQANTDSSIKNAEHLWALIGRSLSGHKRWRAIADFIRVRELAARNAGLREAFAVAQRVESGPQPGKFEWVKVSFAIEQMIEGKAP